MASTNLTHILRQIGHELGLTKRTVTELSDILYATGGVTRKFEDPQPMAFADPMGSVYGRSPEYIAHCLSHFVIIKALTDLGGQPRTFELCGKEWYDSLNEGVQVKVIYRDQYQRTTDYVPPDFSERQVLGGPERTGYTIENVLELAPK